MPAALLSHCVFNPTAAQTPSLVPPALLERILDTLQQQYGISPSAEISLEADPGTFDLARLQQYRALGVNRLSMGVQCFDQVRAFGVWVTSRPSCSSSQCHTRSQQLWTKHDRRWAPPLLSFLTD